MDFSNNRDKKIISVIIFLKILHWTFTRGLYILKPFFCDSVECKLTLYYYFGHISKYITILRSIMNWASGSCHYKILTFVIVFFFIYNFSFRIRWWRAWATFRGRASSFSFLLERHRCPRGMCCRGNPQATGSLANGTRWFDG